jgi:WD40 repeat protein
VTFSANGEYLLTGGLGGVGVWRVEDGKRLATVEAWDVLCLAVSKDGRWITAGTLFGDVFVWDAQTYENVIWHNEDHPGINRSTKAVDFSPDSTHVVSASKDACIWDIATHQRVQTLDHGDPVRAAKYSPQGDRIATATENSVRVWDSNNGHLLVVVKVAVTPWYNAGLLWLNNQLLSYPTVKSSILKHPPDQQSRNGQFPIASTSRASLYQNTGNSSHTQHCVPSHSRTRRHTPSSVSSNTLKTSVQLQSHQTTAFLQLVERTGKSPLIVCPASL